MSGRGVMVFLAVLLLLGLGVGTLFLAGSFVAWTITVATWSVALRLCVAVAMVIWTYIVLAAAVEAVTD